MKTTEKNTKTQDFILQVKHVIAAKTEKVASSQWCPVDPESIIPGKMLRTRLAARLAACDTNLPNLGDIVSACAATELVHTASLFHDDVIDNGMLRRGVPSLWRSTGSSSAVLIGDLFLCESIELLLKVADTRYVIPFILKVREVCIAEIEQERTLGKVHVDEGTCMRLARMKTGPLFAFVGLVCGGDDVALSLALEEVGYRIGTAYQLADDLLDIVGDEQNFGKTLGTDSRRGKFTIPLSSQTTQEMICEKISELCFSSLDCLNEWPQAQRGLELFFEKDLQKVFERIDLNINISI